MGAGGGGVEQNRKEKEGTHGHGQQCADCRGGGWVEVEQGRGDKRRWDKNFHSFVYFRVPVRVTHLDFCHSCVDGPLWKPYHPRIQNLISLGRTLVALGLYNISLSK